MVTLRVGMIRGCVAGGDSVALVAGGSSAFETVITGMCMRMTAPASTLKARGRDGGRGCHVFSSVSSTLMTGTTRHGSRSSPPAAPPVPPLPLPQVVSSLNCNTLAEGMCSGGGLVLILGEVAGETTGEVMGDGVLDEREEEGVMVGESVPGRRGMEPKAPRLPVPRMVRVGVKNTRWSGPELSELLLSTEIESENSDSVSSLSLLSLDSELVRILGRYREGVGSGEGTGVGTGVGSSVMGERQRCWSPVGTSRVITGPEYWAPPPAAWTCGSVIVKDRWTEVLCGWEGWAVWWVAGHCNGRRCHSTSA